MSVLSFTIDHRTVCVVCNGAQCLAKLEADGTRAVRHVEGKLDEMKTSALNARVADMMAQVTSKSDEIMTAFASDTQIFMQGVAAIADELGDINAKLEQKTSQFHELQNANNKLEKKNTGRLNTTPREKRGDEGAIERQR